MAHAGQLCRPPDAEHLEQLVGFAANGRLRQHQIAELLDVSRRTIVRWLARPDVQAAVSARMDAEIAAQDAAWQSERAEKRRELAAQYALPPFLKR